MILFFFRVKKGNLAYFFCKKRKGVRNVLHIFIQKAKIIILKKIKEKKNHEVKHRIKKEDLKLIFFH